MGYWFVKRPRELHCPTAINAFLGLAFTNGSTINCLQQKQVFIHDV